MQTTGNLGLKKPDGTDIVDIADLNGNMDVLDTAVKNVQDHTVDTVKHITAAERTAWNAKASTAAATTTAAGLMAAADKAKLDGVAAGANKYVHPNHTGDVTSTGDGVTAIAPGVIVNADINAAAAIDASKIGTGTVSNVEFGYLDGVTSGIQGQLNSKAPLATTPQQTTADITYYVRTDGNDGNNGLANTAGGAFRTIGKAVSMIPQNVNHAVVVNIAAGTYAEDVVLKGFGGGGTLGINASGTVNVTRLSMQENTIQVTITGITATTTTTNAIELISNVWTWLQNCNVTASAGSYYGVMVYGGGAVISGGMYSNKTTSIWARSGANVFVVGVSGSGSGYGYLATEGAKIGGSVGTMSATAAISSTQTGGIIAFGDGVVNPWGDNTSTSRSYVQAAHNASQTISSSVRTKINYGQEDKDQREEYDGIGRFTVKQSGLYHVDASLLLNANGNFETRLYYYVNGQAGRTLCFDQVGSPGAFIFLGGSKTVPLNAGDYLEIYIEQKKGVDIITLADPTICSLNIDRIG
ncbi:hypothetical protein [Paenibacillus jilunlii]|uniref:C1q domain-containing protein n=1 Tax=Paenibacillus jilunlii TaxID=682956 RepID=A0A1G9W4A8_9BACL|nr:hypothetical protein [Paenibacillus jilunlii]KWX76035.1 hypothetical protein AML91_10915 [Paenibacillus jilunlii]SDM79330.1 hypothetical protein SAMN05216191_11899 [Paenibacillus jilunlii]